MSYIKETRTAAEIGLGTFIKETRTEADLGLGRYLGAIELGGLQEQVQDPMYAAALRQVQGPAFAAINEMTRLRDYMKVIQKAIRKQARSGLSGLDDLGFIPVAVIGKIVAGRGIVSKIIGGRKAAHDREKIKQWTARAHSNIQTWGNQIVTTINKFNKDLRKLPFPWTPQMVTSVPTKKTVESLWIGQLASLLGNRYKRFKSELKKTKRMMRGPAPAPRSVLAPTAVAPSGIVPGAVAAAKPKLTAAWIIPVALLLFR